MTFDPTTWVLALSGSALLIAGGAILRGDSKDEAGARRAAELEAEVDRWRAHAERAGFKAAQEIENADARAADAERELVAAGELIETLKRDLAAERSLAANVEVTATELRGKLRAAEDAARAAEQRAAEAEERARSAGQPPGAPRPQTSKPATVPPPGDTALRREVDQLKSQLASVTGDRDAEKKRAAALLAERDAAVAELATEKARGGAAGPSLAAVTAERDAAREKVEALERLVDGVRARSRELTAELKELKSKLPQA